MVSVFSELSIIIVIALVLITLARLLKQPLIIAYLLTGVIISPSILNIIKSTELISTFSELGVTILLFTVGLNLNPKIIKDLGKVSLVTGIGQALFTAIVGFLIASWLGFDTTTSIYLAVALTFSSTIIIAKLLSDKGDIHKLYGRIAIGFLIVQDILAIIALLIVSSYSNGNNLSQFAFLTFAKGALLIVGLFAISYIALPRIMKPIAKSTEFMLLFSLGWCIAIATLFELYNFSIEIGALLAGVTLSLSPYRFEISSRLKPLRDFFVFLFFIWIGTQIVFSDIAQNKVPILAFSLLVLIGNPLIMLILMGLLKYKKRTALLAGLASAQISEFSHILIALGVKIGHLQQSNITLITLVSMITIAGSTYFIIYGEKIYHFLAPFLSIFERKSAKEKEEKEKNYDVILFGAHRLGHDILKAFNHKKKSLLVVDYNPDVIETLSKRGFTCIYGDIADIDLFDDVNLCNAKMLISTVPDTETNILFMKRAKMCNPNAIILAVANSVDEAMSLYNNGSTYVITPKFIGSEHISNKIKEYEFDIEKFKKEQLLHKNHLRSLE